jgi:hypothetical protein
MRLPKMIELEERLVREIMQGSNRKRSFDKIVSSLENKFLDFAPHKKRFSIEPYFCDGKAEASARKLLLEHSRISDEWLKEVLTPSGKKKIDFSGLYIFYHDGKPFYVGISKGVIGRICQHVKGHSHYTSTLAFKMALIHYRLKNGISFEGGRKSFDFKNEVTPVKQFLLKQQIAWMPIDSIEERYLFEVYCSMRLRTFLNSFDTH